MTRDKAIEIFGGPGGFPMLPGQTCAQWVDVFAALGMLKLDEPKSSPEALVCEVLASMQVYGSRQRQFLDSLSSAGLKVVHRTPQASEEAHD